MIKSRAYGVTVSLVILLFFMFDSVHADRGIRVEKIVDLNHGRPRLGEYKALIIGINDYESANIPDLETAVTDAKAMAKILKDKYGFSVKLLHWEYRNLSYFWRLSQTTQEPES